MKTKLNRRQSLKSNISQRITDFTPKGYLIRYPLLVDSCILRFVNDFQDSFKQTKDGRYALSTIPSKKDLETMLLQYVSDERSRLLSKAFQGLSPTKSDWIIVADTGVDRRTSYQMLESDIDIGLKRIETVFNSIFNKLMKDKRCTEQTIYCKHRLLLSDDWIKISSLKVFGKDSLFVLDKWHKPRCVVEDRKEINELSKKENSLIVKEASDWIVSNISNRQRSYR